MILKEKKIHVTLGLNIEVNIWCPMNDREYTSIGQKYNYSSSKFCVKREDRQQ